MDEKEILRNTITSLEAELKIKNEECKFYKNMLDRQSENTVKMHKINLKSICVIAIASNIILFAIVAFFVYCYFNTDYAYNIAMRGGEINELVE